MYASSQDHSVIDQGPPRSIGRHQKFVLLRAWRGHRRGGLMYLFAWVASCRWRARVTRVFVIRGGVAKAAPAVGSIGTPPGRVIATIMALALI